MRQKNARKKVLETFFKYWMLSYLIIHSKERKRYLEWYLRGWKKRGEQGATTLCIKTFSIKTLSIFSSYGKNPAKNILKC